MTHQHKKRKSIAVPAFYSWGVDEVVEWLGSIGYSQHGAAFRKHSVTGKVLADLQPRSLTDIGVSVGKRFLLIHLT